MLNRIFPLLAATVSLLFLASCIDNDRSLGEQFITDDYVLKIDTVAFDLPVTNKIIDTLQGTSYEYVMFGYLTDPIYGSSQMGGASFMLPYSDSTYLGIEPKLQDIYISLVVDSTLFYDPSQEGIPQNLHIYEMTSALDSNMIFNNSITPDDYNPKEISVGSPILFGKSTVTIYLSEEFGNKLLSTTKDEFHDLNKFVKKIPGLYITTDVPEKIEEGGRLNLASFSNSVIYVDYLLTDPERGFYNKDTTETFLFGYSFAINQYRTGSQHLVSDSPTDSLYLEGLNGVKPHISGAELKGLLGNWLDSLSVAKGINDIRNAIVLSRASLVFPYEMPEDYARFDKEHPAAIFAFTNTPWATDTLRYLTPVDDVDRVSSPGVINRNTLEYVCDITAYAQDIIQMEEDEEAERSLDIWIAPLYSYSDDNGYSFNDFEIVGLTRVLLNGTSRARHPQLKLTYTLFQD